MAFKKELTSMFNQQDFFFSFSFPFVVQKLVLGCLDMEKES